ncbi:hypothetical protein ACQKKE_05345 [Desemzia incerta]|uniref:hypothetical protein n=1 Tax=Desemzia incerta TaxID=82801 RepID=UPI003D04F424
MKITYKSLTVDEAVELVKEDSKREDLFFESSIKEAPQVLKNLTYHTLDISDINKTLWFQREVEDDAE